MFTMTQKARAVVQQVTGHPRLGEESGLRIASQDEQTDALGVGMAAAPGVATRSSSTTVPVCTSTRRRCPGSGVGSSTR